MKRVLALLVAMVMMVSTFTGCKTNEVGTSTKGEEKTGEDKTATVEKAMAEVKEFITAKEIEAKLEGYLKVMQSCYGSKVVLADIKDNAGDWGDNAEWQDYFRNVKIDSFTYTPWKDYADYEIDRVYLVTLNISKSDREDFPVGTVSFTANGVWEETSAYHFYFGEKIGNSGKTREPLKNKDILVNFCQSFSAEFGFFKTAEEFSDIIPTYGDKRDDASEEKRCEALVRFFWDIYPSRDKSEDFTTGAILAMMKNNFGFSDETIKTAVLTKCKNYNKKTDTIKRSSKDDLFSYCTLVSQTYELIPDGNFRTFRSTVVLDFYSDSNLLVLSKRMKYVAQGHNETNFKLISTEVLIDNGYSPELLYQKKKAAETTSAEPINHFIGASSTDVKDEVDTRLEEKLIKLQSCYGNTTLFGIADNGGSSAVNGWYGNEVWLDAFRNVKIDSFTFTPEKDYAVDANERTYSMNMYVSKSDREDFPVGANSLKIRCKYDEGLGYMFYFSDSKLIRNCTVDYKVNFCDSFIGGYRTADDFSYVITDITSDTTMTVDQKFDYLHRYAAGIRYPLEESQTGVKISSLFKMLEQTLGVTAEELKAIDFTSSERYDKDTDSFEVLGTGMPGSNSVLVSEQYDENTKLTTIIIDQYADLDLLIPANRMKYVVEGTDASDIRMISTELIKDNGYMPAIFSVS